jgi:hypothetical protein
VPAQRGTERRLPCASAVPGLYSDQMYRVLFYCNSRPNEGWQGKGTYDDRRQAELWAVTLQAGTRGTAIVLDAAGNIVFRVQ